MILGLIVVAGLYLLVNLAYLRALSLGGRAASDAVAADVMDRAFGAGGAALLSAVIRFAAHTSANAIATTRDRTGYDLARTFHVFVCLSRWEDRRDHADTDILIKDVTEPLVMWGAAYSQQEA